MSFWPRADHVDQEKMWVYAPGRGQCTSVQSAPYFPGFACHVRAENPDDHSHRFRLKPASRAPLESVS